MHAFQRVATSHAVLQDPVKRMAYDVGEDLPRERQQQDNLEGFTFQQGIMKRYFPERFDFHPFGDPHATRRWRTEGMKGIEEQERQQALALEEERRLREQRALE